MNAHVSARKTQNDPRGAAVRLRQPPGGCLEEGSIVASSKGATSERTREGASTECGAHACALHHSEINFACRSVHSESTPLQQLFNIPPSRSRAPEGKPVSRCLAAEGKPVSRHASGRS